MEEEMNSSEYGEWHELFTKYRSYGKLPASERDRFRDLSAKLRVWLDIDEKESQRRRIRLMEEQE
jgi:hypothetical protein